MRAAGAGALAERFDNPDPLTYRVTLRRDVKFHDGHELTSDDVLFTCRQYLDPAVLSPWKGAFKVLESVTALGRYEVEFRLREPFAAFPIQLVSPPIVPAGAGRELAERPTGTGPYALVRYDVDDKVLLAPFDDFFGGPPRNAGLVLRVIPDDTMRGLELRKGNDPDRARALLDDAGYPDPDGPGPAARLRLTMKLGTIDEYRLQATVIQQQLRQVGIDLDVRSLEFATLFSDVVKSSFQIVQMQWTSGALVDPDILRRVFHSDQAPPAGFNRGRYHNPEVDRLIDLASQTMDEAARKEYYGQAQRLIADDAPYVSLWNRTNVETSQPDLTGLRINVLGSVDALKDVRKGGARP